MLIGRKIFSGRQIISKKCLKNIFPGQKMTEFECFFSIKNYFWGMFSIWEGKNVGIYAIW